MKHGVNAHPPPKKKTNKELFYNSQQKLSFLRNIVKNIPIYHCIQPIQLNLHGVDNALLLIFNWNTFNLWIFFLLFKAKNHLYRILRLCSSCMVCMIPGSEYGRLQRGVRKGIAPNPPERPLAVCPTLPQIFLFQCMVFFIRKVKR